METVQSYFHSVALGEGHHVPGAHISLCLNREEGKGYIHRSKVSLRDWGQGGREGTEELMLNQAGGALEAPPSGYSAARRLGRSVGLTP